MLTERSCKILIGTLHKIYLTGQTRMGDITKHVKTGFMIWDKEISNDVKELGNGICYCLHQESLLNCCVGAKSIFWKKPNNVKLSSIKEIKSNKFINEFYQYIRKNKKKIIG